MSRAAATALARVRSRDASPAISDHAPRCMAGMTFFTAMFATPRTPQRTFVNAMRQYRLSTKSSLRCVSTGMRNGVGRFGLPRLEGLLRTAAELRRGGLQVVEREHQGGETRSEQ